MTRIITALLFAGSLAAGELSGIWMGQYPARNGDPIDIAFKFTQEGESLTGKLYGDYRSTPVVEGKVTGDQISFVVIAQEQAGNQINETRMRFTGTLKAGELELTRSREGVRDAANGGAAQVRGDGKQTMKLKRLL
jgi:hypothetical protein